MTHRTRAGSALLVGALLSLLLGLGVGVAGTANAARQDHPECAIALDPPQAAQVRDYADAAEHVFVGKVTGRERVRGKVPTLVYEVNVDKEFVGNLGKQAGMAADRNVEVVPQAGDGEAAERLRVGSTYLFFASSATEPQDSPSPRRAGKAGGEDAAEPLPRVETEICGGTTRLPNGLSARLDNALDDVFAERGNGSSAHATLTDPAGGASTAPSFTRIAAPGAALVIAGLLGLALVSFLGRRPS